MGNDAIEALLFKPVELHGRLSSEVFADLVPNARLVKVSNHLQTLFLENDPQAEDVKHVSSLPQVSAIVDHPTRTAIFLNPSDASPWH